jgi:predicted transcriptional regulator
MGKYTPTTAQNIERRTQIIEALGNESLTVKQLSEKMGLPTYLLRAGIKHLGENGYIVNDKKLFIKRAWEYTYKATNKIYRPSQAIVRAKKQKEEKELIDLPPHIRQYSSGDKHWTRASASKRSAWTGSSLGAYLP